MSSVKDKNVHSAFDRVSDPGAAPSESAEEVAFRLSLLVDHLDLERSAEVARKSPKQIRRYCAGAEPPFGVLQALVREGGVSFDWIALGTARTAVDHLLSLRGYEGRLVELDAELETDLTEQERSEVAELRRATQELIAAERHYIQHFASRSGRRSGSPSTGALPQRRDHAVQTSPYKNELVHLPLFDIEASAGLGVPVGPEVRLGAIAFDPVFLRAQGARPDQCSIIAASGDSMQPAIPDGSLLVVDHSQKEIRNGHIMVVNVGEDLLVKRVRRRLDGLIELISDNPAYAPETLGPDTLAQLRVVGRVVYFCRVP